MIKRVIGTMAIMALSACGVVHYGGAGETSTGETFAVNATDDFGKSESSAEFISPDGWRCTGSVPWNKTGSKKTGIVPITCDDGARGQGVYSINTIQHQITIDFSLDNGRRGRAIIGRT